jgi:signal-transduction protein with cAMP-binding, CBS, and nucleotidyltransferase domain
MKSSVSAIFYIILYQLISRSETRYFAKGSIVADYREAARGLMVITSGQVCVSE